MFKPVVVVLALVVCMLFAPGRGLAADALPTKEAVASAQSVTAGTEKKESPWLVMPTFSSNPKLGTTLGLMAAYMHYFDEKSQVSMFGMNGMYTSTNSAIIGVIAKASWGEDHHRLVIAAPNGLIKNDYNDFLGTGKPLKTEDNLHALVGRYLYRVTGDWFAGLQGLNTNYQIIGQNALNEEMLQTLGLTGFKAGGIGLAVLHDSRDIEFSPTRGWYLNMNNIAYRDWIAGDNNFDVYRLDLRVFWEHWDGQVLAVRQSNQWTFDAPPSAYAPIVLRGYKMGQYLGKYMSSVEAEERVQLAKNWRATVFAGVGCLYGNGQDCNESENIYPSYGAGIQYVIKPKEGMVANLEYAQGKKDNNGIYLKFGYAY
ncbi:MAG TPA: hypothetical protein VL197_08435 [Nitrospirota bacterium]|nr:hypothetical protein [Nitrospirota bacterium]